MKVALDEDGVKKMELVTSRAKYSTHTLAGAYQSDGSFRVLMYTVENIAIKGDSGPIVRITVVADETMEGEKEITVKNQEINTYDATAESGSRTGVIRPADVTTSITVTAIESVKADADNAPSTIYTVDGKKVKDATKGGVYIKDGKKVLVK
jgi:hypothetical protein